MKQLSLQYHPNRHKAFPPGKYTWTKLKIPAKSQCPGWLIDRDWWYLCQSTSERPQSLSAITFI